MTFDDEGVVRNDDESELARIQSTFGEGAEVGEILAEMDDLVELGFRSE